ncbi:rhodanese-like domain-containing protein [Maritimibacter sp. HL-12]|jgi:rhodanese-related sulfurtransferase|uniref:rhodanese-like domain-containing protein n=1 Tax=Maritimibacter sp. HL-12 TaxID=1162418 RepID=UPI000A0F39F2|nr:rhodanese-like domain-containing protein [Maritimibacter sp. HL-12]SMH36121.1 Rhodanese-related sulfurtransferase [Maritimibacter sp. HL-12]
MSNISKRSFLGIGIGALAGAVGIGYAMTNTSAAGFEHRFMSVEEMQATGGLIVDIRTPPEWVETGVIDGARLVTFNDPESFLAQVGPAIADGRDLVLICRSGNRTAAAARALEGVIPNRIVSVDGGMRKVIGDGYKTVPPS